MDHKNFTKILWLAHRDPLHPSAGGAERTILEVCSRLTSYGMKVTLLTGGWDNAKKVETLKGIKIMRFGRSVPPHFVLPIHLLLNHYDVVVSDLGHAIPWIAPVLMRKKTVVFFRHLHARSLPGQVNIFLAKLITAIEKTYPIIYRDNTFVTESTSSIEDLKRMGIEHEKIIKIPPGIDPSLFYPRKKYPVPTIVYFGGMRRYKRPEHAILMFKRLQPMVKGIRMKMIGEGPVKPNLIDLARELGINDVIEFTGRLSNKDLAEIVASSWLNVHTSVTEGWGLSVIEASSAGTPTVAYNVPGISEVVEQGINGIRVSDGDISALANAALKIISSPEKWWTSSCRVAEKYSWDRTAQKWYQLIENY